MRYDTCGLFWDDTPPPKPPKKDKIKRIPPDRFWEADDYLPNLAEARNLNLNLYTDDELYRAGVAFNKEPMIFDIECYGNYFLIAFISVPSGKVVYFEKSPEHDFDIQKLKWVMTTFCIVGFNSRNYDMIIGALAVAGKSTEGMKLASDEIIQHGIWGSHILKSNKAKALESDHIDLIEVAPLRASLKVYAGRMHSERMQDLPFKPETILNKDQMDITRWYCINDLTNTIDLFTSLSGQLDLRKAMGKDYGIDLRSKSDAQIAEYVIASEVGKLNYKRATKPTIAPGTIYKYQVPEFIKYQSPLMNWALDKVRAANFIVAESGSISMPQELSGLELNISSSVYRMGIGGLHSSEKCASHQSDDEYVLIDRDVTSYYPMIILNLGLFPAHLGPAFLTVYRQLVTKRITAKNAGHKLIADSLKIVINGSFGKLGSKYSTLYSPDLLIQVTLTGQLSLLMLIERLELAGIAIVSANTDGIVIKCLRKREHELNAIVEQWEIDTGFNTEETRYSAVYSRDVNNYLAILEGATDWKKGAKAKGAYAKAALQKNPTNEICTEAVKAFLVSGIPVEATIQNSKDFTKFISVRTVKGGAVEAYRIPFEQEVSVDFKKQMAIRSGWKEHFGKWVKQTWIDDKLPYEKLAVALDTAYQQSDLVEYGDYLGKAIRWYYSSERDENCELVYSTSGNKVPRSEGAKPVMLMPKEFPGDINYDWYIQESRSILEQIGYAA
jgi:hypothetical protein